MLESKHIAITGANGFIGSNLVDFFIHKGWSVSALARQEEGSNKNADFIYFDLTKELDSINFDNVSYLIHCAYIRHENHSRSEQLNIRGSKKLFDLCRKSCTKIIFLSSISALQNAKTHYGKQKFYIEQLLDHNKDVIIRPGLVIGNGGLIKEMKDFIVKWKMVPLIDGGEQPIQSVHIDDLITAIYTCIQKELSGTFSIAEPDAVKYKDFYTSIFTGLGMKPRFIPIPYFILYLGTLLLNTIGIPSPISKESLLNVKNLKKIETNHSLETLGLKVSDYKSSLQSLLSN